MLRSRLIFCLLYKTTQILYLKLSIYLFPYSLPDPLIMVSCRVPLCVFSFIFGGLDHNEDIRPTRLSVEGYNLELVNGIRPFY